VVDITPKQAKALTLLAAGCTNAEAAKGAGVSSRTVDNWKSKPDFQKMLSFAVQAQLNASLAQLVAGASDAVKELNSIITSSDTPSRVKVTAISTLLNYSMRVREWALEDRLESLEGLLDGDNPE
jgi:hypothetical protein